MIMIENLHDSGTSSLFVLSMNTRIEVLEVYVINVPTELYSNLLYQVREYHSSNVNDPSVLLPNLIIYFDFGG